MNYNNENYRPPTIYSEPNKSAIQILDECGISHTSDPDKWDNGESLKRLKEEFFSTIFAERRVGDKGGDTE